MAKQNSINRASQELTIDPGASGDSFLQFSINGTGEFRVGVDDTDDSFCISQGSALGTNDMFKIEDTGESIKPLQPAFLENTGALPNVTGDGTVYTVVFAEEYFDQGGDFDGTSTFTAPVGGCYRMSAGFLFMGIAAANTTGFVRITTSNRVYRGQQYDYGNMLVGGNQANPGQVSALCDMDLGDTAIVETYMNGGAKIVGVGISNRSMFSGELVC